MTTKTFAVQVKDYLGVVYNIAYVQARDTDEALGYAHDMHRDATVKEIVTREEMARVVEDLIAGNNERMFRPQGGKEGSR